MLSSEHSTREPNPSFSSPSSDACSKYISSKRGVPLEVVPTLIAKARALYAAEDALISPQVTDMPSAVAVACLASLGTLRPGPDSDCAACGPACTHESRPKICELYCTSSVSQEVRVFTIQTTSEEILSNFWIKIGVIILSITIPITIIAVCLGTWLRCLYYRRLVPEIQVPENQNLPSENRELSYTGENTQVWDGKTRIISDMLMYH